MQEPWHHNTGISCEPGYGGEVYYNTVLSCCVCRVDLFEPDIPVSTGGKAKLAKALTDWVVASDLRLWMCELMTTVHERDSAIKDHVRSSLEEERVMTEIVQQTRDGRQVLTYFCANVALVCSQTRDPQLSLGSVEKVA